MKMPGVIGEKQLKSLMSSWASVLKTGPVPRHVAFIMDGNRRFAKKKGIERYAGHSSGYDIAEKALEWCIELGLNEMTLYAFSIENFKRSADEVHGIIDLCKKQFSRMLEPNGLINRYNLCVRVIGDLSLIPRDFQQILAQVITKSANNKGFFLNVCFAYTARDDMCMAMREIAAGVKDGLIKQSDISASLLEKCMYTSHCQQLDLLVRTSGEVRLSDFMLWESSFSLLAFEEVLWPEMSVVTMYKSILRYQRNYDKIKHARDTYLAECERAERESDIACVIEKLKLQEISTTEHFGNGVHKQENNHIDLGASKLNGELNGLTPYVDQYAKMRRERIDAFLAHVYDKRAKYVKTLLPSY